MNKVTTALVFPGMYLPHSNGFSPVRLMVGTKRFRAYNYTYCREIFFWDYTSSMKSQFLFGCNASEVQRIAAFVRYWEKHLKLKTYTKVQQCVHRRGGKPFPCAMISPSSFWAETSLRKSFFTALLRASRNFTGRNYVKALFALRLFNQTKYAVERFLAGYNYSRRYGQWHDTFYGYYTDYYTSQSQAADKILKKQPVKKQLKTKKKS